MINKWLITTKGFEETNLVQLWRFVTGKIRKNGKDYFFKLANKPSLNQKIQNEIEFNTQICTSIKQNCVKYFDVPEIFESGYWEKRYFYIGNFVEGFPLLQKKNNGDARNIANFAKHLENITKINSYFLSLTNIIFTTELGNTIEAHWKNSFKPKIDHFYTEIGRDDLNEVKTVFDNYTDIKESYGLCHRDFVPWHMIWNGEKIVLIDAEHAGNLNPKFYDTAYFFCSLYTSAQLPDLAKKFLNLSVKQFKTEGIDINYFRKHFRPILASRIIAKFWDAKNSNKDLDVYLQLKNEFLKNKLI